LLNKFPDSSRTDYAAAYNNLGDTLRTMGKPAEAEVALRRAIDLNPSCGAYANLAFALRNQGKVSEAVGFFQKAVRLNSKNARVHYELGHALGQLAALLMLLPRARKATNLG
jgi:tetratricopeptide (TPR) repeat protein